MAQVSRSNTWSLLSLWHYDTHAKPCYLVPNIPTYFKWHGAKSATHAWVLDIDDIASTRTFQRATHETGCQLFIDDAWLHSIAPITMNGNWSHGRIYNCTLLCKSPASSSSSSLQCPICGRVAWLRRWFAPFEGEMLASSLEERFRISRTGSIANSTFLVQRCFQLDTENNVCPWAKVDEVWNCKTHEIRCRCKISSLTILQCIQYIICGFHFHVCPVCGAPCSASYMSTTFNIANVETLRTSSSLRAWGRDNTSFKLWTGQKWTSKSKWTKREWRGESDMNFM